MIYDLDLMVLIEGDKDQKAYREIPFANLPHAGSVPVHYRKTGEEKSVAGYKCELYEVEHSGNEDIHERTCYSDAAPGAAEATAFYRAFQRALATRRHNLKYQPKGVVLMTEASTEMPALTVPPYLAEKQRQAVRD